MSLKDFSIGSKLGNFTLYFKAKGPIQQFTKFKG